MKRTDRFDRLRAVVYLSIFLVASAIWIGHAQQPQPGVGAQPSNFTGGDVKTLTPQGRLSYYVLGPGARTKWHTHEGGQLILPEEGIGRFQIRGEIAQELRPGQPVWSPAGKTHWHGAAPDSTAKLYQISRGETTWLEAVSDKDYLSAVKR
jgi:quercetin dioxygenase-like cupin family protein